MTIHTFWRLRRCLLGAAAAALCLTTTTALAGSGVGAVFNLGQTNTVNGTSTLTGVTAAPQLTVKNTSTNSAATALNLSVAAGRTPFKVNSAVKVANLNADQLDGKDSTGFYAGGSKVANADKLDGFDSTYFLPATGTAADSDKLDGIDSSAFWKLGGNAGTTPGTDFLGSTDNQALELKVNGQRALRLEPDATSPNLLGGFSGNTAQDGAHGATVAGGGQSGNPNLVSDHFGTVGGGLNNRAGSADGDPTTAQFATVAGGSANTAGGYASTVAGGRANTAGGYASAASGYYNAASGDHSAVAGGSANTAGGYASTVAGGEYNTAGAHASAVAGGQYSTASGVYSTVAGGYFNIASGYGSTVAGGQANTAGGSRSFAAGFRAQATHYGSFVWADGRLFDIGSYGDNTFTARTTGGARFVSAIDASTGAPTAGVELAAGGGSWSSLSDRAAKRGFAPVDRRSLLARLDRVPITRWGYRAQAPSIRHLGPTAQDFRSAFGLGEDARHIDTIDSEGIALAAVQGLYRQNRALEWRNNMLTRRMASQNARLARLERTVAKLSR